jgi:hypothetical protein
VIPAQVITTESYSDLSIEERKCRLVHETEGMELFNQYTQNGCEFECAYNQAIKKCKCIPWNYVRTQSDQHYPFCDTFGNFCFKTMFTNQTYYKICPECIEDCTEVTHSVFESKELIDTDSFCRETLMKYVTQEDTMRRGLFYFFERMKDGLKSVDSSRVNVTHEIFKEYVKEYVSIVNVEIATKTLMRSIKDKRVSFPDMLATLGNVKLIWLFFKANITLLIYRWNFRTLYWNVVLLCSNWRV